MNKKQKNKGMEDKRERKSKRITYHVLLDLLRDVPDHDLGVLRAGRHNVVIEGVEVNVKDNSLVGLEKGGLSGELSSGGVGSNPEGASSSGLPAASNVAGVGLDKVRVPSIAGRLDVVNGKILLGSGTEDVAVLGGTNEARHA